ncbi:MAG TPA: efflux RND transporter periplasmic adaptor subunit [Candidatus Fimivivens sp.]|nr:efflux RND transporter periplasmic adaptor subunit [Candidatus Fimivivens sp.]
MKKKAKIVWSVILVILVGSGIAWFATRKPAALYVTEAVTRTTVSQTVSVTGELMPQTYADLSFMGVGTVDRILVSRGDAVKAGQTIATLDTSVLRSQLANANVALAIAVDKELLARRQWRTMKPEEKDAAKLATEQARQQIKIIDTQIAQTKVVSPIDGVVTKLDVHEGETALAGAVIGRVSKGDKGLVLEARVPEADVAKLKVGMDAVATFDSLTKSDIFRGAVSEIEPSSTVVQGVVSYVTRFRLSDADPRLREGMSSTIDTVTAKSEDVLAVPFRAIISVGDKKFIDLSRDGLTTDRREVTVGLEGDDGMVEVKQGVSQGDPVVTGRAQ